MKLTVIIPVYNTEAKFLFECIDSVLNIDCFEKEIFIINDGSTNCDTIHALNSFRNMSGVKIFDSENRGVSHARNIGLDNATGDFIMFVDSDDTVIPENFKYLLELQLDDIDVACFSFNRINENSDKIRQNEISDRILKFNSFFEVLQTEKQNNISGSTVWGKIYRSKLLKSHRFLIELSQGEDAVFNISLGRISIIEMNIPIYNYRVNELSATIKYNSLLSKQLSLLINAMEYFYIVYSFENLEEFYSTIFLGLLNRIMRNEIFHKENPNRFKDKCKQLKKVLSSEPYSHCVANISVASLPVKTKIKVFLYRHKWCFLLYLLNKLKAGI